jgi:hypothetical protein
VLLAGEIDCCPDVGDIRTADDKVRPSIVNGTKKIASSYPA